MGSYNWDTSPVPVILSEHSAVGHSFFFGLKGLAVCPLIFGLQKHTNKKIDKIIDKNAITNGTQEWNTEHKENNLEVSITASAGSYKKGFIAYRVGSFNQGDSFVRCSDSNIWKSTD